MNRFHTFGFVLFLTTFAMPTFAQSVHPTGAVIVRAYASDESRQLVPARDAFTLSIGRIVVSKKKGWFKEDKSAGVQVSITVTGMDRNRNKLEKSIINQIYQVDVTEYDGGRVSLPLEQSLVSALQLRDDNFAYVEMNINVTLLKHQKDTGFGIVVKELMKLTQENPFPVPPFSEGVKLLSSFTTRVLDAANDHSNRIDQRFPTATIHLNFNEEKTGIFAIVFSTPDAGDGYVDIAKETSYSFQYQKEPIQTILVGSSTDTNAPSHPLKNDYILFSKGAINLAGWAPSKTPQLAESGLRDYRNSISSLELLGMTNEIAALSKNLATAVSEVRTFDGENLVMFDGEDLRKLPKFKYFFPTNTTAYLPPSDSGPNQF